MTEEERQDRRLAIEEGRLALDTSFAKKWAPLIISAAITLCTTVITTGFAFVEHNAQEEATQQAATAQLEETRRATIAAKWQKSLENGRAAATLYFEKLADLRSKVDLTVAEQKRFARDLNLIAALSDNAEVRAIFVQTATAATESARGETRQPASQQDRDKPGLQTAAPADALRGLPDLIATPATASYQASEFLAFPQVPAERYESHADKIREALATLGFRVQAVERMASGRSPHKSQIRYYRPDHKAFAEKTAVELTQKLGVKFEAVQLPGGAALPNGVMEFWLGES